MNPTFDKTSAGQPYPLGAHCVDGGVNFALFSAHAKKVELCLYTLDGKIETQRITLPARSNDIWHGFVYGCPAGTRYGYRVYGPYEPNNGHRFNHYKLLIDPYARALHGELVESTENCGYQIPESTEQAWVDDKPDTRDNAHNIPKCVVLDSRADTTIVRPMTAWDQTVIYEAHVKGLSQLHPDVEPQQQGRYRGVASAPLINHYKSLGVTAVELLPVQYFCDDAYLLAQGLLNYWGYNTLNFFTPAQRYAQHDALSEFRQMTDALHKQDIEVILDVVYNHTAEGNEKGPTLSFRGIDNKSYYCLEEDPQYYVNDSGCGNALNCSHPLVLQMVVDSLRYWMTAMGVDGFRFDLATILGREREQPYTPGSGSYKRHAAFFKVVQQDPVLQQAKMIAEPWDCGPAGYQSGNFPAGWSEWNDQYRDAIRQFWNGDNETVAALSRALHGSSEVFEWQGKGPQASINFITSHDGFTLHDLVSYSERHNEENGEHNLDGHGANYSCNHGVEGQSDDPAINAERNLHKRNLLATLLLSQGVPMLLAGDEMGHTQSGNNNAYCQDSALTWLPWVQKEAAGCSFVARLLTLRQRFALLRQRHHLHAEHQSASLKLPDISWLNERGELMGERDWVSPSRLFLGMLLAGDTPNVDTPNVDTPNVEAQSEAHVLLVFNNSADTITLPLPKACPRWDILLDTSNPAKLERPTENNVVSKRHSVMVLSSHYYTAAYTNLEAVNHPL